MPTKTPRVPPGRRAPARAPAAGKSLKDAIKARPFTARVRMYRQGVGDSFLLSFPALNGRTVSILIDCGVVSGTKDPEKKMELVAQDILAATNKGEELHAVVGTHPHWDHLSGFLTSAGTFSTVKGKEIWLAWTENPKDPEARQGKAQRDSQLDALKLAMTGLAATTSPATRAEAASINELLSFQGPDDALPGLAAGKGAKTTSGALEALRSMGTPIYRNPGDVIEPAWLPGVRIYVLGPPRDRKLLGKMLSSTPGDLYSLGSSASFVGAVTGAGDAANPFEPGCLFPMDGGSMDAMKSIVSLYNDKKQAWRRIDDQWLLSSQTLALNLDNAINNLSLVLAFELIATKQVLVFAADAQVGNWKSWASIEFKVTENNIEKTVKAAELLARTVFYKVGHHASHNATLREGGLEAMTSPELVAAIPVDESLANNTKHWQMPAPKLYERLLERTDGRVFRSDGVGDLALGADNVTYRLGSDKDFESRVHVDPSPNKLWVEYEI